MTHKESGVATQAEACPTKTPMTVSAIVPARNEELTIVAAVESLAAQPEISEIFVVNDQSTDGTAAQLQKLSARFAHLRVLNTDALPTGWVGKNYAVSLGAAQATGEWLLFTDADGMHLPASTARALGDAEASGAGLVSYSPEQEMPTWWERALIPFVYTRLAQKFSYDAVNDPDSPAAAANGQYLLVRREDYARIGGHAAVAGEVLEDVALARLAKQQGVRLHFASGARNHASADVSDIQGDVAGLGQEFVSLDGRDIAGGGTRTSQLGSVDSPADAFAYPAASNSGCAWAGAVGGAPCGVCRDAPAQSFSRRACLILYSSGCAVCGCAARVGTPVCAGASGVEGAGVSGE